MIHKIDVKKPEWNQYLSFTTRGGFEIHTYEIFNMLLNRPVISVSPG